jgi:rod shape-determining protein MreD
VRRVLLVTAAILAAVLIQVTVLNNVPFPGGAGPDLVLVVVVALALAGGPREGAVTGFAAGLALDIAPPASGLVGQSALVFCLVGYGCGRLRGPLERSAWLPLAGVALGAVAGELLYALVGLMFSDPDVSVQAVRQVLPAAVTYDVLISPFVLYAVGRLGGYARGADTAPAGLLTGRELALAGAAAVPGVAAHGAVRDTGTGRSPRLRAAAGHRADGWIGGRQEPPGQGGGAWTDRRSPPRLRLRGGVAGSAAAPAPKGGPGLPRTAVNLRLGAPRRRDGAVATRRGPAGAWPGALFGAAGGAGWAGRAGRPRSGSLAGGPSALRQAGRGRRRPEARLRLGSKRRRDGLTGASWLARLRPGTRRRRRGMGRGTFGTAPAARRGATGRTAAPKFRRAGGGLARSRGSGLGLRSRRWRGRFSGRGKGGLR